tara:strand:- start:2886 stop:4286 length:1401 start_codon:yes stop_codon:yes gene_type:complete
MMDMTVEEEKRYAEKMRLLQQQQNTQSQTPAPTVESQVSVPVQPQAPAPLGMTASALRTQELTNSFLGAAASPEEIEAEEAGIRAEALRQGGIDARGTRWRSKNLLGTPIAGILNHFKVAGVVTAEEHAEKLEAEGLTKAKAARMGKRRAEEGLAKSKAAQLIATDLLGQEQEGRTETRTIATEDRLIDRTIAAEKRAKILSDGTFKSEPYWDGKDPTRVRNLLTNGERYYTRDTDGELSEVFPDAEQMVPYKAPTSGSSSAAVKRKEYESEQIMKNIGTTAFFNSLKIAGDLGPQIALDATGKLDFGRWIQQTGFNGESDVGKRLGLYQQAIKSLSFQGVAPLLPMLGINATDTDLEEAFEAVGGLGTEPLVYFTNFKASIIPKIIGEAQTAGVRTEEELAQFEAEMNSMVDKIIAQHAPKAADLEAGRDVPSNTTIPGWTGTQGQTRLEQLRAQRAAEQGGNVL